MRSILILISLSIVLFLFACSRPLQEASTLSETGAKEKVLLARVPELQGWEKEWNDALATAKKEGKVLVYSTSGSEVRKAFSDVFPKKYGIELEMVVAKGAEVSNKVLSERRAGLYLVDVYVGGGGTLSTSLKPAGALDTIRPSLLLPEVLDPNTWWEKRLPITYDREKKYMFRYSASMNLREILTNGDLVKEGELNSYYDLLQPKWKGKIALMDPTTAGRGQKWFGSLLTAGKLDVDYMKQLAGQEPFISRDDRLPVEWIARGKYLVGIAMAVDAIKQFKDAGMNLREGNFKEDVARTTAPGGGYISLINKAPHPAAARVFINWMLSKEGQTVWSLATGYQSGRVDVPTDHIESYKLRIPGLDYFDTENEDFAEKQQQQAKLAQEIFGHLLR